MFKLRLVEVGEHFMGGMRMKWLFNIVQWKFALQHGQEVGFQMKMENI
jgi:hypothetical protein